MSTQNFILNRLLLLVPILFGVSVLTFSMMHLVPGDIVDVMFGLDPNTDPEAVAAVRAEYNLDRPLWEQYLIWVQGALFLDFGRSPITGDVSSTVLRRLPATLMLGIAGWLIALSIAIPAGVYAAVKKDHLADEVSRAGALVGIATPNFWLGLVLLLIFAVWLDWFPSIPPDVGLLHPSMLWYLILPAVTLGTASTALLMRVMRSSMVEELNKEYVRTARAKGLPERTVILKHVLRNSLISVVTLAALLTAAIVDGAVVIEVVFSWPGLGDTLISAIQRRDIFLIQAIILLIGVSIVLANLVADIVYMLLDPRIRY